MNARRRSLARWLHFVLLWGCALGIFVFSFAVQRHPFAVVVVSLVGVLALVGMASTSDAGHVAVPRVEDPLLSLLGAGAACWLTREWGLASVAAAALVGTIGGLAIRRVAGAKDYHGAPLYSGAFVGVSAASVFANVGWVLVAGLVAGLLWSVSRDAWVGVGGKMGTIALIAGLAVAGVASLVHNRPHEAPSLNFHGLFLVAGLVAVCSTRLTSWLSYDRGWGAVLGSAAPTVLFSLMVLSWHPLHGGRDLVLLYAWYGASFVGMTSPRRLNASLGWLGAAALIFTVLSYYFGPYLSGFGGTAGATALFGVFATRGAPVSARALQHLRQHAVTRVKS